MSITKDGTKITRCTAFLEDGKTVCNTLGRCIRVITKSAVMGRTLHRHWVCAEHRTLMGLPEHGVVITPLGQRPYRG